MIYANIHPAIFQSRPNRFIAHVLLDGETVVCHVKNTGRCRELLIPGVPVFLQESRNPARKTKFDLISVYKGERLINIDSQAPNQIFSEWAGNGHFGSLQLLRPEAPYGNSRFDFYFERGTQKGFAEIKGVTLEENGDVLFPDAPTERGRKHLRELASCVREGFEAWAVFIVQMKGVRRFLPNARTDPDFAKALQEARQAGVKLLCLDCRVTPDSIIAEDPVPVFLPGSDPLIKP